MPSQLQSKSIDVPGTAQHFRHFAGWCDKIEGEPSSAHSPAKLTPNAYFALWPPSCCLLPAACRLPPAACRLPACPHLCFLWGAPSPTRRNPYACVQVIKRANDTEYGLAAACWTQSIDRMQALTRGIKAGTVWVRGWMGMGS